MEKFWEIFSIVLAAVATGGGGYIWGFKRSKAEATGLEVDNVGKNLKIYQELIDDIKKQFDTRIDEMEKEIEQLRADLADCKKRYLKAG